MNKENLIRSLCEEYSYKLVDIVELDNCEYFVVDTPRGLQYSGISSEGMSSSNIKEAFKHIKKRIE